ncbi:MAG: isochorismatase family protein [Proteobacteria bacterium]|nr:isochorismatase family protein [Pseudomonadota bacterium]
MLMNRDDSVLLVVDMQERLLPVIHEWQRLLDNVLWLVQVAQRLEVPILPVELYPQGLGQTHADIRALLPARIIVQKMHFSCVAGGMFRSDQAGMPGAERRQVVICGIESHVCVMQTALELREQGRQVFVVADAVSSRDPASKALALERMRRHEVEVVSREMVAYEWLKEAGTPLFREINRQFLR